MRDYDIELIIKYPDKGLEFYTPIQAKRVYKKKRRENTRFIMCGFRKTILVNSNGLSHCDHPHWRIPITKIFGMEL